MLGEKKRRHKMKGKGRQKKYLKYCTKILMEITDTAWIKKINYTIKVHSLATY